jgi:hypothetical protein
VRVEITAIESAGQRIDPSFLAGALKLLFAQ